MFSPHGELLMCSTEGVVLFLDTTSWKVCRQIELHGFIYWASFSSDGKFVTCGGFETPLYILDVSKGTVEFESDFAELHYNNGGDGSTHNSGCNIQETYAGFYDGYNVNVFVRMNGFSDGDTLQLACSVDENGSPHWTQKEGSVVTQHGHSLFFFSPQGRPFVYLDNFLLSGKNDLWDTVNEVQEIRDMDFSPDGTSLLTLHVDGRLITWKVPTADTKLVEHMHIVPQRGNKIVCARFVSPHSV